MYIIKQPILVILLEVFCLVFEFYGTEATGGGFGILKGGATKIETNNDDKASSAANLYPASDKIIKDNKIDFTDPDCDFDCLDFSHLCLAENLDCDAKADECPYSCGLCDPCDLETAQRVETALGGLDKEIDELRALLDKLIPGCMTDQDCLNGGRLLSIN